MKIAFYRKIFIILLIFLTACTISSQAHAQMMGSYGTVSITPDPTQVQQQQKEEATGKKLFEDLSNHQITCQKLTDNDFEKIGEYAMSNMFGGNTAAHVGMNERIQQVRGDQAEEQMHIQIGKNITGCYSQNTRGGAFSMMNWGGSGYGNMMYGNSGWGFGFIHLTLAIVVLIDLILVGVWLWKQIRR